MSSRQLQLVEREPYTPSGRPYKLIKRLGPDGDSVEVESKMDDAALFFDGPYRHVTGRLGDNVTFRASDEPLTVLGLAKRR